MAAHMGETAQETARKTGDFYCQSCDAMVHVTKGHKIPPCANGHKTFDTRTGEPGRK
jgi:competence CoiA-like predicted nuclease